ncbi:MAG TPA: hypothetical protein GXZ88_01250 [Firmicutes bacterium]|jgi:hypothetical protein|nr:hypothetical protein [Candidatus Fermentithermobacillaceae bacterium]
MRSNTHVNCRRILASGGDCQVRYLLRTTHNPHPEPNRKQTVFVNSEQSGMVAGIGGRVDYA